MKLRTTVAAALLALAVSVQADAAPSIVTIPMIAQRAPMPTWQMLLERAHLLGESGEYARGAKIYGDVLGARGYRWADTADVQADVQKRYGLPAGDLDTDYGRWLVWDQFAKWLAEQGAL